MRAILFPQPEKLKRIPVQDNSPVYAGKGRIDYSRLRDLLESASTRTEEKFLVLGGRLTDFHRRSKDVARQAETVSAMLLGEEATQAVSGLQLLVQGLGRHRGEIGRMSELDRRGLKEIDLLLEKLYEPLSGFRKIIKTLQSLGIATRIESSESDRRDSGFLVFAVDLKELSSLIDSHSAQVLAQLGGLRDRCRNAREKLTDVQAGQNEKSEVLLRRAAAALAEMGIRTRQASGQTTAIFTRAAGFAGNIGEVVASIQFQDIVRQKIMHVQQALDDMESARLGGGETTEILSLQTAQLQLARSEMEGAVVKVIENLRSLAAQISATAEQTRNVAGMAGSTDASVFREFEEVIGGISLLLQEGEMIRQESVAAVGTVAEAINDMAGMLEEIEFLGEKMKVVALNAGIRAAHVGRQGAALGVIAESIQQMSREALVLTKGLASGFREIITCARNLGDGEKTTREAPEILLQKATALLWQLQNANAREIDQLQEMDAMAATLADDLLQVAIATDVHQAFSHDIAQVVEQLNLATPLAVTGTERNSRLFRELLDRYTMNSEREVHQGQQKNLERKVIPLSPRRNKAVQHDLGDNVELF